MKKTIIPAICILLCALCILIIPTEAEASIYDNTVRLHILAPSDSIEDQNLKLQIRDFILEKYGTLIDGVKSSEEAEEKLRGELESIKSDCESLINSLGYDYSVNAELSEEWFCTREYQNFSLPSGRYISLTVTLGSGDGQNWWCVMYPPLCLDASVSDDVGYSDDEWRLISKGGYRVKFKLLEVSSAIFGG